jgi:hypothetical protein
MIKPLVLPKITDYWDSDNDAILRFSDQLRESMSDKANVLASEVSAGIREHVRVLNDQWLPRVAFVIAEDLYRVANTIPIWDSSIEDYLACSASVFFSELSQRNFRIHYVIDNCFDDMQRPLQLFPLWFRACGFHYECPQAHQAIDVSPEDSRAISTQRLRTAFVKGMHYVILDTDSESSSFEAPIEQIDAQGVLTIVRNEGAGKGSKATVLLAGKQLD